MKLNVDFLSNRWKLGIALIFYHFIFHFIVYQHSISSEHINDAELVYEIAKNSNSWSELFGTGRQFISFIIYPMVKIGLSYYLITLVFSIVSLFGFLIYYDFLLSAIKNNILKAIFFIIILFPSFHYWTSFISKEAIVFTCMALLFTKIFKKRYFSFWVFFSFLMLAFVRSYLLLILIIPYVLIILLFLNFSKRKLAITILLCLLSLIFLQPLITSFFDIESLSIKDLIDKYNQVVVYSNKNGKTSINLAQSNFFERFRLLMFRPYIYEVSTLNQLIICIELIFTWILFITLLIKLIFSSGSIIGYRRVFFTGISCVILISFLSSYIYNIGLASRMRVMIIIYLFLTIILLLDNGYKSKKEIFALNNFFEKVN